MLIFLTEIEITEMPSLMFYPFSSTRHLEVVFFTFYHNS